MIYIALRSNKDGAMFLYISKAETPERLKVMTGIDIESAHVVPIEETRLQALLNHEQDSIVRRV